MTYFTMPAFNSRIKEALATRQSQGLTRTLRPVLSGNQVDIEYNGCRFLNFSNNDYLGLANDAELVRYWQQGLTRYGAGSGASPLVTGFSSAHKKLEHQLCEWLGYERAILFNSGFSANQAVLFTLLKKGDHLLQDRLNHASLMEAGVLSNASMTRFKHNDITHLSQCLDSDVPTLVVTEGVFSMDGDRAPLENIAQVLQTHTNTSLMVDDAHGIGVLGPDGSGSCRLSGIHPELLVVTFGKAFGMSGAAIMCRAEMGDYLTQFARHHVYSTAMPPAQAYALSHAIKIIQSQQWRRDKLLELQHIYQSYLGHLPNYIETVTPIKPFLMGGTEKALKAAEAMRQLGIWLTAIRPPTVPVGSSRLRITLTAAHSIEQVKTLCIGLNRIMEDLG
jgi:8-amino-7-oxononanoate synthase